MPNITFTRLSTLLSNLAGSRSSACMNLAGNSSVEFGGGVDVEDGWVLLRSPVAVSSGHGGLCFDDEVGASIG